MKGSHEGFSAGAVAALRKSQSVIGSLADRIRVPDNTSSRLKTRSGTTCNSC
ncbi:MAG: hypothetical protein QM813_02560 [Verrucomicrobiota bacterium]